MGPVSAEGGGGRRDSVRAAMNAEMDAVAHDETAMPHIKAFLIVSRYEFAAGGIFFLLVVSALASRSWEAMWSNREVIGLGSLVWFLSHLIGSQVNCIADRDIDRVYKTRLAEAVDLLGVPTLWLLLVLESMLALVIAIYMARITGQPILPVLWTVGWFFTMAYSLEPLRFKRRGVMNPIALLLVLYVLPVAFGYLALARMHEPAILLMLAAVGMQMAGLILMNEIEDVPEDRAHGILTPCVRYGSLAVVVVALALFLVGGGVMLLAAATLTVTATSRVIMLLVGVIAQGVIIYDLAGLALSLWRSPGGEMQMVAQARRVGRRNAVHFAILGAAVATASALSMH